MKTALIAAILYIAYDTILTARTGQTVGKRLLHLRVADLSNGATPSTQTSLIRAVVLWLPFAFCCARLANVVRGRDAGTGASGRVLMPSADRRRRRSEGGRAGWRS